MRRLLCHEPRGHADMYGCFLVPPDDAGADLGVLFWHKDGYSTACGHGTIALGAWAVESGRIACEPDGEAAVTIDVPSGRVVARVRCAGGAVASVTFRNVPAYVIARGVEAAGVRVDVAYGGAIYASVGGRRPRARGRARAAGRADRRRARDQARARGHRRGAPRRRAPLGHLRHDPLRRARASGTSATSPCSPTARSTARRAAPGPRRASRCSTSSPARAAARVDRRDDVLRPRRRADRGGGRHRDRGHAPTGPASTASCSTRATSSAPGSCCDEVPRRAPRCRSAAAADALEAALAAGLDPEAQPARTILPAGEGELLVMPAAVRAGGGGQARHRRPGRAARPGRLRGVRRRHAGARRARRRHRPHQPAHGRRVAPRRAPPGRAGRRGGS